MFAYDERFRDKAYGQSMCGKGWNDLIGAVYDEIAACGRDLPDVKVQVVQVKEKFGTLRFYHDTVEGPTEGREVVQARIESAVRAAETLSAATCEECGAPGELTRRNSYLQTLCKAHTRPGGERGP